MLLAPITRSAFVSGAARAPFAAAASASALAAAPSAARWLTQAPAAAAVATSAPLEAAVDGVARLVSTPIVDFPGIAAGQTFDIVQGSKAGAIGVRGSAELLTFDPDHAVIHVKAGRFGVHVDVTVDIIRLSEDTVRITSKGSGVPDSSVDGRVVTIRTNYSEFERIGYPNERTIISHDGAGNLVIDTAIPRFGVAHLLLDRR